MKISELERNIITKKDADLWPYKKSSYKGSLPITIGNFEVLFKRHAQKNYNGILIGVWDDTVQVANMFITPEEFQGIKCYAVQYTAISPNYQGQNIGYELYRGLIVLTGIPLITTGSQSRGARKLWLKLAQDPQIKAFGFSLDKLANKIIFDLQPNKNQTELKSKSAKIMVYDNWSTGIILVIKNGPYDRKLDKIKRVTQTKAGYFDKDYFNKSKEPKTKKKPDIFGISSYKKTSPN